MSPAMKVVHKLPLGFWCGDINLGLGAQGLLLLFFYIDNNSRIVIQGIIWEMSSEEAEFRSVPRQIGEYEPCFQPFLLHTKNYVVQYNHLYLQRLTLMRSHMERRASAKWGTQIKILEKIIDLESTNEDVVIIGMLSKDLKLRKSVLEDFKGGQGVASTALQPLTSLVSDRDSIIMEDFSGRVTLEGVMKTATNHLVTGVVVAVKGVLNEDGILIVDDWVYNYELKPVPGSSLNTKIPSEISEISGGKFVLLVSGLLIGSSAPRDVHDLSVQLLVDFVCGRFGDEHSTTLASRIARVIIAGNSVVPVEPNTVKEKFSTQKYKASLSTPSKQFDIWTAQLLSSCFVDVMPGATDPANIAIPQQPFHPCLFPHSSRFGSFERVSNPYQCKLDNVSILGHSGQPVRDIAQLTAGEMFPNLDTNTAIKSTVGSSGGNIGAPAELATACPTSSTTADESQNEVVEVSAFDTAMDLEETVVEIDPKPKRVKVDLQGAQRRLDILKKTLEWGHLCPTAPDTLPSYPFAERDPYHLCDTNMPNILFAGNQPGFASELVEISDGFGPTRVVRCISVPGFRETGTVVLCNIADPSFPCFPMTFR